MHELEELQHWLQDDSHVPQLINPFALRLVQAVQNGARGMDLAVLIRGVLRHESEKNQGGRTHLRIPIRVGWPDAEMYAKVGVTVLDDKNNSFFLYANPWEPLWLPHEYGEGLDRALFALAPRSSLREVEGDPFLAEVNRRNYRCASQRDAMRTVLTSPLDATVLLNLPTGTGKSLCGQLPALLLSKTEGVTVVVVPTVALALDQERALMPLICRPSAYFSSTSRQTENEEIRAAIMNGSQRIVFASPESVLDSLNFPLQIAAEKGLFKMLVIDEAHIVDGWGESFRPAFQELAGWRKMMLRCSKTPFRTVLLSATVTESCLDSLETLFGDEGSFSVFSSVVLRPEPAYWYARCSNKEEKIHRLMEAIHQLPRPLIVYTTEVEDSEYLYRIIRESGYVRVRLFHGDTRQDERETIINDWNERRVDIVVATSAFGLGVDQSEVRTVIHACVPESIDRFYQEVGRGGRDGNACLSLMLYEEDDIQRGRNMSTVQLIGVEKGRSRWEWMFARKQPVPGKVDMFRLPVSSSPVEMNMNMNINGRSNYNEQWNLRILTMMSRMKVIAFDWEEAGQSSDNDDENWRVIRILKHDHLDDGFWDAVKLYRQESRRTDRNAFELMERLLQETECMANVFQQIYTINGCEGDSPRREVRVLPSCGGCPACRRMGHLPRSARMTSYPLQWSGEGITPLLRRYLDPSRHQLVLFREVRNTGKETVDVREKQNMMRTIQWFVKQGVRHIAASPFWVQWIKDNETLTRHHIFFTSFVREYAGLARQKWKIPTLVIHEQAEENLLVYRWIEQFATSDFPVIFMIPSTMEHPTRTGTLLSNILNVRSFRYEDFRLEVGI